MTQTTRQPKSRLQQSYPGLLPGFFTPLAEDDTSLAARRHMRCHLPFEDPSAGLTGQKRAALRRQFAQAAVRAMSIILNHADVVHDGDAVIFTCALAPAEFDILCAYGAEFEDLEVDDPGEDDNRDLPVPDERETLKWA